MHARSPNRLSTTDPLTSSECAAKSLFPNISDVSPCDSGFCPDSTLSPSIKCLRMNILATSTKKCGGESEAKSLFQNILAVSPCGSRFCADIKPIATIEVFKNEYFMDNEEKKCRSALLIPKCFSTSSF